jgi:hypothetical protein
MKEMTSRLLGKIFSGRFVMVVVFSLTVCKGFLMGLISSDAFLPVMILIVEWYFKREDRKNGGPNDLAQK